MKARPKTAKADPLSNWLAHHIFCLLDAARRMWRNAGSSLITLSMIAVALAIPLSIYALVNPFNLYLQSLDQNHQVTLFLNKQSSKADVQKLITELQANTYFKDFAYISADQALAEFAENSSIPVSPELLGENPLPGLITATANVNEYSAKQLQQQIDSWKTDPLIDQIVFDYSWLERLQAIIEIAIYIGLFLLILLSITVVLVIFNSVRWEIEARRDEFRIIQLIGGTDRYISRPFLYIGLLIGGLGALSALILVAVILLVVETPVEKLFALYESLSPQLEIGLWPCLITLVFGATLGLIGAWVAANYKLRDMRSSNDKK